MAWQQQRTSRRLDWMRPGKREVSVVGNYVRKQGPKLHPGLGGSSELDVEHAKFVTVEPYERLEHALKQYITNTLRIQGPRFDDAGLLDRINGMEKAYENAKEGFWHRLWYRMGDNEKIVSAWLDLIPTQYGLSVIKAGIAVVFKLAESSKDKGQRVFDTFSTLQKALLELGPHRARFLSEPEIRTAATELREAIIKAIEDMFLALTITETPLWNKFAATLKRENVPEKVRPTPDTILKTLENYIEKYNDAVKQARDRVLERAEAYGHLNAAQIVLVHGQLEENASLVETMHSQLDGKADIMISDMTYIRRVADESVAYREERRLQDEHHKAAVLEAVRGGEKELQRFIMSTVQGAVQDFCGVFQEAQAKNRTLFLNSIMDSQKRKAIDEERAARRQKVSYGAKHTAVVSLDHLCLILAQPLSAYNSNKPPDLPRMFKHPANDLRLALTEQSRFPLINQGQVQSLLTHPQFLDWMPSSHPSLLLVDANIPESSRDRLSAISVFCSTLITSLTQVYPDAVLIHFFCGLHTARGLDWYGPNGLVRSLIMQLLMKLDEKDPDMQSWNLDFINDRGVLQNLEQHCLDDLCEVLHGLLYEFPLDTHIYCIIDAISCFDIGRLLKDLRVVMERLQEIVDDPSLVPVFKVLLTNPGKSMPDVKNMPLFKQKPARLVSLSRQHLVPGEISGRVMEGHLLKAPSPMGRRTPSPFRHSRGPSPAVSVRKRIAAPEPVVRELFVDQREYQYDEGYWEEEDGRWNY